MSVFKQLSLFKESALYYKANRAAVDGAYAIVDVPKEIWKAHSRYGALMKYHRLKMAGKPINPKDFRGQDLGNIIRTWQLTYGEVKKNRWWTQFDIRWFYFLYLIAFGGLFYELGLTHALNKYNREMAKGLHLTRPTVGKDYIEEYDDPAVDPSMEYPHTPGFEERKRKGRRELSW